MKATVVISVYKNVKALSLILESLRVQTCKDFDIIISEDGEDAAMRQFVEQYDWFCRYKHLTQTDDGWRKNRALNRAVLAANNGWLIFIDGDAAVGNNIHFINNYWKNKDSADIIVGGLIHPTTITDISCSLRFKYEQEADKHRSAKERSANPYDKFTAFNIMVKKNVFDKIKFDESCIEYGYEDVLWGLELKRMSISITHIDNPLIHTGLDTNEKFLYKRDLNRFFWGNYHLNDFFEDNFDYVLEKRGKENVKERLKEEAPILLIEYDINKKEIPRRRSIDELLEIMKNSDDKKVKQACMGLLISRFDIYKEKESDLEDNKKHLEKLINENKIDKNVSNVLTSYIKSRENVTIKKR